MNDAEVAWDASSYDVQAEPHEAWGRAVLDRLQLQGNESVLDAGCGTGLVSKLLLDRLPEGRLIGVDASAGMLEKARESIGADPRVELHHEDLVNLELEEPVDAVFSTATFHWILEHERLFARLYAALGPGGRLEAQCGGEGNIAEIARALDALAGDERFSPYLRPELRAWNYASVGDTEARLDRVGFSAARAWLESWPVTPRDPHAFLRTVILPWHLDRLPADRLDEFVDAVLGTQPRPLTVRYVRLNISARKPD